MSKLNLKLLPLFILIWINAFSQSTLTKTNLGNSSTNNYILEIDKLLKSGVYTAEILGQTKLSPRNKILQDKFMKAIKENQEWYLNQQRKNIESGTKEFPYDAKLGLSHDEWIEYKNYLNSIQVEPISSERITIIREDNLITFNTSNELSIFNSISIDLIKNSVSVGDKKLPFLEKVNIKNDNNGFKSSWNGFKWQFANPTNLQMPKDQEELSRFSMRLYTFILGRISKSGKIYLDISISEIENGKRVKNILLPVFLK